MNAGFQWHFYLVRALRTRKYHLNLWGEDLMEWVWQRACECFCWSWENWKILKMQNTSCLFSGLGYYIFRSANSQKNNFRRNPADPKLASEYILYSIGCDFIQWLFVVFEYIISITALTTILCSQIWNSYPLQLEKGFLSRVGGVLFVTLITLVTSSWLWHGPYPVVSFWD